MLQVKLGKANTKKITILLDSGASSTILHADLMHELQITEDSCTEWMTAAGTLSTSKQCKIYMQLPKI